MFLLYYLLLLLLSSSSSSSSSLWLDQGVVTNNSPPFNVILNQFTADSTFVSTVPYLYATYVFLKTAVKLHDLCRLLESLHGDTKAGEKQKTDSALLLPLSSDSTTGRKWALHAMFLCLLPRLLTVIDHCNQRFVIDGRAVDVDRFICI